MSGLLKSLLKRINKCSLKVSYLKLSHASKIKTKCDTIALATIQHERALKSGLNCQLDYNVNW